MTKPKSSKSGKKIRVDFRRNRQKPGRVKDWTRRAHEAEDREIETRGHESVRAKGDLSRKRTIIVDDPKLETLRQGVVIAWGGRYSEVDDGEHVWLCTIRRIVRTRLIRGKSPLAAGDEVRFSVTTPPDATRPGEGTIEEVEPRRSQLLRQVGKRAHAVAANVDQVVIVSSTRVPPPKPHLIDRYIVSTLAGQARPIICLNKIDLDSQAESEILTRYRDLGYAALATSAKTGRNLDALGALLKGRSSVLAGQSGVGKSALINAIEPGLNLRVGEADERIGKGRHTTTTARLVRLAAGGYLVDTPGIRSFDLAIVDRYELEAYFVEIARHVSRCKFPDCTHVHEDDCAVKEALFQGLIHPERYESYVRLFQESESEPFSQASPIDLSTPS